MKCSSGFQCTGTTHQFKCTHSYCRKCLGELVNEVLTDQKEVICVGDDLTPDASGRCDKRLAWTKIKKVLNLKKGDEWTFTTRDPGEDPFENKTMQYIEEKVLILNVKKMPGILVCPKCESFCAVPKDHHAKKHYNMICPCKFVFCFYCHKEWKNKKSYAECGNENCGRLTFFKTHITMTKVFKAHNPGGKHDVKYFGRLCPRPECYQKHGFTIIEHGSRCKHMTCPQCKEQFCILCLGLKLKTATWPCTQVGAWDECAIADAQDINKMLCTCGNKLMECSTHKTNFVQFFK